MCHRHCVQAKVTLSTSTTAGLIRTVQNPYPDPDPDITEAVQATDWGSWHTMVLETEPLIQGPRQTARRQLENLFVQFTDCTFTYTEAQIPDALTRVVVEPRAGTSRAARAEAESVSSAGPPRARAKSKSWWKRLKAKGKNKAEKIVRRGSGMVAGNDVGRRFDDACIFHPGHKTYVQNYITALNLPCTIRFEGCTFEYRRSTLWERFFSSLFLLIISCCGCLMEWTGQEEIADETFCIDKIPTIVDKVILNIQRSAGSGDATVSC